MKPTNLQVNDRVRVKHNSEFPDPFEGMTGRIFHVATHGALRVEFDGQQTEGRWGIYRPDEVEKIH